MAKPSAVPPRLRAMRRGTFNAGEVIIEHVSNSGIDHPLIHLPTIFGIDFSVTKHVLMLWIVAVVVLLLVTLTVRRYLKQDRLIPSGLMNGLEFVVEFIRDSIVLPNVGKKWVNTWAPLILTFFFFIFSRERDRDDSHLRGASGCSIASCCTPTTTRSSISVIHGGTTATGNFNVTAGSGDDHLRRDHHRRDAGPRLRQALEEHRAARR